MLNKGWEMYFGVLYHGAQLGMLCFYSSISAPRDQCHVLSICACCEQFQLGVQVDCSLPHVSAHLYLCNGQI